MTKKTNMKPLSKRDTIIKIANETGITQTDVKTVYDKLIETIQLSVKTGGSYRITGFGSFKKVHRKARNGRNLQTGNPIKIKAHDAINFKVGKDFKNAIK